MSSGYRLGMAAGAMLAAVFPILYIAMIFLGAWALEVLTRRFSTATSNHLIAAGHLILLFGGGLLIFSFLKPLIAHSGRAVEPRTLDPGQEPLLFAYVEELAGAIGLSLLPGIAVDCNVNCCCVFTGVLRRFFRPGLDLVIGLPLVAGLRLDQFSGVLVHELFHAVQIISSRSNRLICSIDSWLARMAFERDAVDERLLTLLETGGPGARLSLRFAQMLFYLGRGVLRLLMMTERVALSAFLRRMELDGDIYQVRVAGSETFVSTVVEMNLLSVAAQRAVVELSREWRQARLIDNYPALIASLRARFKG